MEAKSGTKGIDLRDGMPQLLVLTCADDILLFAKTSGNFDLTVGHVG